MKPMSMLRLLTVGIVLAALTDLTTRVAKADDIGTNFFLKASKSVPRIGRRSMDDYFMKASKSVPRIGRRGEYAAENGQPAIPEKRYFSEKYFGENGGPTWGSIDGSAKDLMQGDEPYREMDTYWQQV